MRLVLNQRIRPRVMEEMDGQWLLCWRTDITAVSQEALSTGETPVAGRMDGGVG